METRDEIKESLDKAYINTLESVSLACAGSEEAKWQLQVLSELHNQRIHELKTVQELEIEKRKLDENRKDRIVKIVIGGAEVLISVGSLIATVVITEKGFEFESKGTYTSRTVQWLSNNFKLFRRK